MLIRVKYWEAILNQALCWVLLDTLSLSSQWPWKKYTLVIPLLQMWGPDTDPGPQDPVLWLQYTNTHGLQKSCEEKGAEWPLSKWERVRGLKRAQESWPPPGQAFIVFLGTLHGGWSSFTMHRFTTGDYLLRTTKDRTQLITSKWRMLQLKGETAHTPYLSGLAQILGRWRYSVKICCLNSGWGSFSKNESHSSQGTMQAWFPTGEPIHGRGSCLPTSLPTGFSQWGLSHISHFWNRSLQEPSFNEVKKPVWGCTKG